MKIHTILSAAITLFNCHISMGQNSLSANELDFKSGIYQTIADFKSNNPMPCDIVESILSRNNDICAKEIDCIDDVVYESKSIWGLCLMGQPYIKYGRCFYPIKQFGMLSTFYYVQTHKDNYFDRNTLIYRKVRDATIVPMQKVIDVESGEILDQDGQPHEIVRIIKSDGYFKDAKIRRKNLGAYITQYNRRHGL